jgi:integrase
MQSGHIRVNGRYWILKVREIVTIDGVKQRKDTYKKLGLVADHRPNPDGGAPKSIRALADLEVAPINAGQHQGRSADSVKSYLESYIAVGRGSKAGRKLRDVTVASYRRDYNVIKDFIPDMQLRQVQTPVINEMFNRLRESDRDNPRAQSAYNNVKSFLSGAFRTAVGDGKIDFNPVTAARSIEGNDPDTHAYSLEEVHALIQAMEGLHTVQALFGVLTFTGLRPEEIRGLKWEDYDRDEEVLNVRRTVVHSKIVEDTKTKSSKAPVPVIKTVKKLLEVHLKRNSGDGYIFHGHDSQKPINTGHLVYEEIIPRCEKARIEWHGLHAFRRGLASVLNELEVPELTVSHILRHSTKSSKSVAGRHYIKPSLERMRAALEKVEARYKLVEKRDN